jgi:hypothetical protein
MVLNLCALSQAEAFAGFPPGRIAIISRGKCSLWEKVAAAEAAGAVAAIIYDDTPGARSHTYKKTKAWNKRHKMTLEQQTYDYDCNYNL